MRRRGLARALAAGLWTAGAIAAGDDARAPGEPALASVSGELQPAPGAAVPATVELRFRGAGRAGEPLAGTLRCPTAARRWRCRVPAGVLDLELRAEASVPGYFWDVTLSPGRDTPLAKLPLRPGPSTAGWIANPDGSRPTAPCGVVAQPDAPREARPRLAAGPPLPGFTAPVTPRGFFQLAGLPPGRYRLTAACASGRGTRAVALGGGAETALPEPLLLSAGGLAFVVAPATDPARRPWRIDVLDAGAENRRLVTGEPVSPEGRWWRKHFPSGRYQVVLTSESGALWATRFFELSAESGPVVLEVPALKVTGEIHLARQPLRARLAFTDDTAGVRLPFESDDEGRFEVALPWSRESMQRRWSVEVNATSPPVNRLLLDVWIPAAPGDHETWIELSVPGASARGTVRAEDGQPQHGAQVLSENLAHAAHGAVATTDAEGSFELAGLPPGTYRIVAEGSHGISRPQEVEIGDGLAPELRLVLDRRKLLLVGQVTANGEGVAGAAVRVWLPPGIARGSARTGADGRFELTVPSDVKEVGLTIAAPGHALKITRAAVSGGSLASVALDRNAGTLILEVPVIADGEAPAATPLLVHDGSVEALDALADWGAQNGGGPEHGRVVVPAVEPGAYALCQATPGETTALWGGAPGPNLCRSGTLVPGNRLELALPLAPTASSR